MTELEIKAAAERLKLETEVDETTKAIDSLEDKMLGLKSDLINLKKDPAEYFRVKAKIQQLFNNTQQ